MERKRFSDYLKNYSRKIALSAIAVAASSAVLLYPNQTHAQNSSPEKPSPSPTPTLRFDTPGIIHPSQRIDQKPPTFTPVFVPKPVIPSSCEGGEIVKTTYYDLHGNPTASGEVMDRNALTAAIPADEKKRKLGEKLGDTISLTDLNTRKKVILRINDTGLMGDESEGYGEFYLDVPIGVALSMGWKEQGFIKSCIRLVTRS